ncbi:MAG: nucleotidyltransferase [Ferruginibacter sp.]
MIFEKDFSDFIALLNKNQVKYVLVGGMAVVIHGHHRSTKDMDIFYERSIGNCEKLLKSINEFGLKYLDITQDDLMDVNGFIKLGYEPVRIDLFCELPGVEFDEVYRQSIKYEDGGVLMQVIHVNHLIENKIAVGRLMDKDDVNKLRKIIKKRNEH